eukprot:m.117716 g.117716  ORF g.117716 m.117716 type:complete len:672 (+) comp13206_c0_seq1:376-2391(+)
MSGSASPTGSGSVESSPAVSPRSGSVGSHDDQPPYLEGLLDKYAQKFPYNWKTRYFELGHDSVLRYYTTEIHDPRREQKGAVNVKDAEVAGVHKNSPVKWFKGRENGMSVTTKGGRVLNLSAPSAAAQSKWLRALWQASSGFDADTAPLSPIQSEDDSGPIPYDAPSPGGSDAAQPPLRPSRPSDPGVSETETDTTSTSAASTSVHTGGEAAAVGGGASAEGASADHAQGLRADRANSTMFKVPGPPPPSAGDHAGVPPPIPAPYQSPTSPKSGEAPATTTAQAPTEMDVLDGATAALPPIPGQATAADPPPPQPSTEPSGRPSAQPSTQPPTQPQPLSAAEIPAFSPVAAEARGAGDYEVPVDGATQEPDYDNASVQPPLPRDYDVASAGSPQPSPAPDYDTATVGGPLCATPPHVAPTYDEAAVGGPRVTAADAAPTYDEAAVGGPDAPSPKGPEPSTYDEASAAAVPADFEPKEGFETEAPTYEMADDSGAPPLGTPADFSPKEDPEEAEYEVAQDSGAPPLGTPAPLPPMPASARQTSSDEPDYAIAALPPSLSGNSPFPSAQPPPPAAGAGSGNPFGPSTEGRGDAAVAPDATYTPAPISAASRIEDWDEDDGAEEAAKDAAVVPLVDARQSFSAKKKENSEDKPVAPVRRKAKRSSAPLPTDVAE